MTMKSIIAMLLVVGPGFAADAFTLSSYAWLLAGTGDYARADSEMRKALAFGLKDARVLEHARAIAQSVAAE